MDISGVSWAMAIWTLVGGSIDRFLCSSHSATYRRWSINRLARRFIIGIFIFFVLVFIEALYCFEASVPNVPVVCNGYNLPCRLFYNWMSLVVAIILPSIFLSIFGDLTIRNVRLRVIYPTINSVITNNSTIQRRNDDRNLTRM